jgi:hypothetical protein
MIRYCSCAAIVIILSRRRFEASSKRLGVLWVTGLASGARGRRETPKLLNSPESLVYDDYLSKQWMLRKRSNLLLSPKRGLLGCCCQACPLRCDAPLDRCNVQNHRRSHWSRGLRNVAARQHRLRSRFEMSDELSSRAWYESGQAGVGGCIHTPRGLVSGARLTGSR